MAMVKAQANDLKSKKYKDVKSRTDTRNKIYESKRSLSKHAKTLEKPKNPDDTLF